MAPKPTSKRHPDSTSPSLDPVCRQLVWRRKVHWRVVQDGVRYYFCDATCKRRYARDPEAYAEGAALARADREARIRAREGRGESLASSAR